MKKAIIDVIVILILAIIIVFCVRLFQYKHSDYNDQYTVQNDTKGSEQKDIYSGDTAKIGTTDAYLDDDENFGQGNNVTIISDDSEKEDTEVASHEGEAHVVQKTSTYKDFVKSHKIKGFKVLYDNYSETDDAKTYTYRFKNTDLVFDVVVSSDSEHVVISDVYNKYTEDALFVVFKNESKIDKADFYSNIILDKNIKYYVVRKKNKIILYNYEDKKQKLMTYDIKSHGTIYHY